MSSLIKCGSCDRHLRIEDTVCPFCAAEIPDEARTARVSSVAPGASRAKRYAARAALIAGTTAAVACGGSKKDDTTQKKVEDKDDRPPPPTPYGCVWPDDDGDETVSI